MQISIKWNPGSPKNLVLESLHFDIWDMECNHSTEYAVQKPGLYSKLIGIETVWKNIFTLEDSVT